MPSFIDINDIGSFSFMLLLLCLIFIPTLVTSLVYANLSTQSKLQKKMTIIAMIECAIAFVILISSADTTHNWSLHFVLVLCFYSFLSFTQQQRYIISLLFGIVVLLLKISPLIYCIHFIIILIVCNTYVQQKGPVYGQKKLGFITFYCSVHVLLSVVFYVYLCTTNKEFVTYFYAQEWKLLFYYLIFMVGFYLLYYIKEYCYENDVLRIQKKAQEKLQIVSEIAASVAHEVRNPLTVMKGLLQILKSELTTEKGEYMDLVFLELDRTESIITDYLQLARPTDTIFQPIALNDVVSSTFSLILPYAQMKNVEMKLHQESYMHVLGNAGQLKQVFINVVKNAIEAVEASVGKITVAVHRVGVSAHIIVSDNGIGMTNEQLQKVGTVFYTEKEKGTGLGLKVTKSIVAEHRGEVRIQSTYGKGTVVTIVLPEHFELENNKY
ncbi:MAG: ATP-binding protein [Bacilli bacterium]